MPALQLPVLLARGNHDALVAGCVAWTPMLSRLVVGSEKVRAMPPPSVLQNGFAGFLADPDPFFAGAGISVTADERRRPVTDGEFPLAFNANPTRVHGNNYVVRLNERVVIVVIDTVDVDGHPDGVFSTGQAAWLEETLTAIEADGERPVVIVASHHGPAHNHVTIPTEGLLAGPEVVALLGRYGSVALWINGHTHVGAITRHQPDGRRGFWEITAPSLIDWPSRFQTVEVLENPSGAISMVLELHEFDTATSADDPIHQLAGLHRLLTANQAGFGTIFPGSDHDEVGDSVLHLEAGLIR
jgi:3',5'-cyclic AMP phosphodiesterase CpdA